MKKYFAAMAFLIFSSAAVFFQSFMHGVGLNIIVATAAGGKSAVNEGFTYSPRFNFIENKDMSVSVGIPLTVGASYNYSADYGYDYGSSKSFSVMINAPLVVNLNMGAGSTKATESRFGYFVGGGFGYHYGTYNLSDALNVDDDYTAHKLNTFGPVGNAGVRFGVGHGSHNIEVKLQYMRGLNNSKANIYGVGSAFNF